MPMPAAWLMPSWLFLADLHATPSFDGKLLDVLL